MLVISIPEFREEQKNFLCGRCGKAQIRWVKHGDIYPDGEILVTYGYDVNETLFRQMPSLRWIQVMQSGIDHLPLAAIEKRKIVLTNVKGIHAIPMCEYVFAMMLYVARDMERFFNLQNAQCWDRSRLPGEIYGKTISIFGAGTIGEEIGKRAKQFGMKTIGINTTGNRRYPFDEMYTLENRIEVLKKSDYAILVLPVTKRTKYLFKDAEFKALGPNGFFINIGRGDLVATESLIRALETNTIRGAALDVFQEDPLPPESPLWKLPNVIVTPHVAAKTVHYLDRCLAIFIENYDSWMQGKPLRFQVDLQKGY